MDARTLTLAPVGSTGTLTTEATAIDPDTDKLAAILTVEAVGATPTISWKLQFSLDKVAWSDARYITDANETAVNAVITRTAAGSDSISALIADRPWRFVRLVVTANTNVTFRAEAYLLDRD